MNLGGRWGIGCSISTEIRKGKVWSDWTQFKGKMCPEEYSAELITQVLSLNFDLRKDLVIYLPFPLEISLSNFKHVEDGYILKQSYWQST